MEYDVVIVGAGPAGLATAIRIKQLCQTQKLDFNVAILDKASYIGAHTVSGCLMDPVALNELIPDWQDLNFPPYIQVNQDKLSFLSKKKAYSMPIPQAWGNSGNYIISLSQLCVKLAEYAESLGVDIYPGFAVANVLYTSNGTVTGVITGGMGVNKDGTHGPNYQAGMEIRARQVVLAEGCLGSVTRDIIKKFNLAAVDCPKTYGLGIKEVWRVDASVHQLGSVQHYVGYPLCNKAYGGGFLYHMNDNLVTVGLVTALDYTNPYLSPYEEFQLFKQHPKIRSILQQGKRLEYGARAVDESGVQSLPQLTFPGGVIVGDSAGFLNVAKIKGVHYAIKSGMLAADSIVELLSSKESSHHAELVSASIYNDSVTSSQALSYQKNVVASYIYKDLYRVRNIRPAFSWGLYFGLFYAAIDHYFLRGFAPWTFKRFFADHQRLLPQTKCEPINYPAADGVVTFDRSSSLSLANLNYAEDQPCHLKLANQQTPIRFNLAKYGAPETRYCPAAVYEIIKNAEGQDMLHINATNCLQCKACEIKDPAQNIKFTPPEGGNGPQYGYL